MIASEPTVKSTDTAPTSMSGSGFVPPLYITSLPPSFLTPNSGSEGLHPTTVTQTLPTTPSLITPVIPSGVQLVPARQIMLQKKATTNTVTLNTSSMTPIPLTIMDSENVVDGKYQCRICKRTFTEPHQLTMHKNVHFVSTKTSDSVTDSIDDDSSSTRPYRCTHCDRGFRQAGQLVKHLRSQMHFRSLENLGLLPRCSYELLSDKLHLVNVKSDELCLSSIKELIERHKGMMSKLCVIHVVCMPCIEILIKINHFIT